MRICPAWNFTPPFLVVMRMSILRSRLATPFSPWLSYLCDSRYRKESVGSPEGRENHCTSGFRRTLRRLEPASVTEAKSASNVFPRYSLNTAALGRFLCPVVPDQFQEEGRCNNRASYVDLRWIERLESNPGR